MVEIKMGDCVLLRSAKFADRINIGIKRKEKEKEKKRKRKTRNKEQELEYEVNIVLAFAFVATIQQMPFYTFFVFFISYFIGGEKSESRESNFPGGQHSGR